ncbi:hypothetical protein [Pseudogemmobacter sonorensis]|uniref:hypothetical protein n=1 Tax=Pseudogemmobacter sonorensis TaxID=2989681 RepID=UPI00369C2B49
MENKPRRDGGEKMPILGQGLTGRDCRPAGNNRAAAILAFLTRNRSWCRNHRKKSQALGKVAKVGFPECETIPPKTTPAEAALRAGLALDGATAAAFPPFSASLRG